MEASMRAILTGLFMLAVVPAQAMTIASGDFADGAAIPVAHIYPRCGGQNVSPELHWSGIPANAKSLALTMIDISVKPAQWSHWIVVDLPPSTTGLARGQAALPAGAKAVDSNFGDAAYDGPCPPKGTGVHRYVFTLWALPTATAIVAPDMKAAEVAATLSRAAIGHASVTGTVTP
jgi:Raf kinase inhibitor-like YbhB/YbcL family protein